MSRWRRLARAPLADFIATTAGAAHALELDAERIETLRRRLAAAGMIRSELADEIAMYLRYAGQARECLLGLIAEARRGADRRPLAAALTFQQGQVTWLQRRIERRLARSRRTAWVLAA